MILNLLVILCTSVGISYSIISFIVWDWNPANWTETIRLMVIFLIGAVMITIAILYEIKIRINNTDSV